MYVAADIALHGLNKVYDAIMRASVSATEAKESDALAYLAAQLDAEQVRAAAKKMSPISASFNSKVSKLEEEYKKFGESAIKLDYSALDFTDLLEEKAPPINVPFRTSFIFKQPVVRITEKLSELMAMEDVDSAQYRMEEFITKSLAGLIQEQIDLYEYFTKYESRYNSEEENKKYSTYTKLRPIPGQLHKIVGMAEAYRAAREQMGVILKNKEAFEASVVAKEESAKQYNAAKAEIQRLIYDEIGSHVEGYYEISQSLRAKS
ncbi:hypothetical protein [Pseudomonas sp. GZD-222]|uniref:hypothetical protein n=1 Tax=Pseudomonas sp. GZD-222 TaxID=3404805 RepID=UPI003BB53788